MKALYHMLAMGCVVITLSLLGIAGFLLATGRLSGENLQAMEKIIRGEELYPQPEEVEQPTYKALNESESLAMSEKAIARTKLLTSRQLEQLKYKEDQLKNLKKQLDSQKAQISQLKDELAQQREAWAKDIRKNRRGADDEGFQRELKLYEQMDPKQVRDIFMDMPEQLAAEFMSQMKPQTLADVLVSFKSVEEKTKRQQLLNLMRDI